MKKFRLISAVLAILLAVSAVSLPVFADDTTTLDITTYPTTEYLSQQAKVDTMTLLYEDADAGYAMYFDLQSGEFALENLKTGEYLFSNPYDIGVNSESSSSSQGDDDPIRQALLSQIIIQYQDTMTGASAVLKSYTDAALTGGQLTFKNISGGVRVEYAIGTVDTKRLIPQWIEKSRFETQILDVLATHVSEFTEEEAHIYQALSNISSPTSTPYGLVGPAPAGSVYDPQSTPRPEQPQTYEFLVENEGAQMYVLQCGERMKRNIEQMIRKYCPDYTYDQLEADHEMTGYEGDEKEPPLFRLAVEYIIDENGLTASIPAKSIRYNETNYALESIVLLPYFGCTTLKETGTADGDGMITRTGGYIFIPDGSGTLLTYYNDDGTVKSGIQGGSMYGFDYAYESLDATNVNAETFRIPVFGLTEYYDVTNSVSRGEGTPAVGNKLVTESYERGFFAIIEEGDAFASIRANLRQTGWAGASGTTEYSTVYALFTVKQADSVDVGGSIGSTNSSMSTTSDTKYTGNYTIRYIMLSDPALAEENGVSSYDPSYIGMANAYRDYLIRIGAIDELLTSEVESSLPLYIHSFGAINAQDTFLSFPVTVNKPLTTFEDVITMSEELKGAGITNVNFILEGFANGNMSKPYYPSYVKWSSVVGGKDGLEELLTYAEENGIGIYPEFDFANIAYKKTFSGFSFSKHATQTMSGKYTTKREYDPIFQVMKDFGLKNVVSSGAYADLFAMFAEDYDKYDIGAISAMSLGTDLSSDFNEDYPLTREDSKENTEDVLKTMKDKYGKVLIEGGNAYALVYATDVVGLPLDNSKYQISSYSIPFIGMVLHGYMNYAGNVINTEGDVQYEVLKSLENGAALYFMLSYQNTLDIKNSWEMGLSDNYSISFDTWKEDVIRYYNMLNDAVKDLQTATITDHSFVTAYRLDSEDANFLFTQYNTTLASLASSKEAYYNVMDEVDELRFNSQESEASLLIYGNPNDPDDPINDRCEVTLRDLYNAAVERTELAEAFNLKYTVDGVVSVTYTTDAGEDTVFFINYNSYDVAIEYEGKLFILAAESFIDAEDIEAISVSELTYEVVTAYMPSSGQLSNYQSAQENYNAAVASGDAVQISRAEAALDRAISAITRTTTNVVKLTDSNGTVGYFNYTTSNVIYEVSENQYAVLAPQSYIID